MTAASVIPSVISFNSRTDFALHVHACMARARRSLDLFDPDCAPFGLGTPEADQLLRTFLKGGGQLRLALHDSRHLETTCPRFLRLLRDFSHLVECRRTSRGLRQLTDSFCVGDSVDVVRRFHSDHARGEAAFGMPDAADICRERFAGIWEESTLILNPTTTGL